MWQMGLRGGEQVDAGSYPERPGEADCSYYMRTGTCRFGMTCKFNHPPNRALVIFSFHNLLFLFVLSVEHCMPVSLLNFKRAYSLRKVSRLCFLNSLLHMLTVVVP